MPQISLSRIVYVPLKIENALRRTQNYLKWNSERNMVLFRPKTPSIHSKIASEFSMGLKMSKEILEGGKMSIFIRLPRVSLRPRF